MKKWHIITTILVVLWLVSLGSCISNSTKLGKTEYELSQLKTELSNLQKSYDSLIVEYNKLQGQSPPEIQTPTGIPIVSLPYSWTQGDIMITILEVFLADSDTREGYVGEGYQQYKVRISYKNTSHRTVHGSVSVGNLKLKTSKGNLYDPKYVGGEISYSKFDPEWGYETNNYAFNIRKGEKPVELWKYEARHAEQPSIMFKLDTAE